jgi:hypothetical protein
MTNRGDKNIAKLDKAQLGTVNTRCLSFMVVKAYDLSSNYAAKTKISTTCSAVKGAD